MRKLLTSAVLLACILLTSACTAGDYEVISLGRGSHPKWSPDGRYLACLTSAGVKIYDLDSQTISIISPFTSIYYDWLTPTELLFKHERNSKTEAGPVVIVDWIKFSVDSTQEVLYSESMPIDAYRTSRLWRLSNGELGISREDTVTVAQLKQMLGREELDTTAYYVDPYYTPKEIWLRYADGRPYKKVTQKAFILPELSPDGKHIACIYGRYMDILDLNGRVVGTVDSVAGHSWLPDSKRLAYNIGEEKDHDIVASEIFIADITGENVVQVTNTPHKVELFPSVSPDMTKIAYVNYASDGNYVEIIDLGEALK